MVFRFFGQVHGNLLAYDEYIGGSATATLSQPTFSQVGPAGATTIAYDGVNRLTGISDSGGWSRQFSYDQWGNMSISAAAGGWSLNVNAPVVGTAAYNANNQRTDSGLIYDAAGNLNAMNGFSNLTFDAENRLLTENSPTPYAYAYDGEGRRVLKSGAGNTTVYVYDASGELAAEYNSVAPTTAPPCATCYLTTDHLGSVRLVTDASQHVISRHDYLPFGEEVPQTYAGRTAALSFGGTDAVNQKFTAKERDSESGLDYFGARYYGSALGRFTSADPIYFQKEMLIDPQRFNLYAYVRNNPLRLVDPTGETIQLTGETEEERRRELAAIQSAVGNGAKVGMEQDKDGNYNVTISGDTSKGAAKDFASIIGNSETAKFSLVSKYEKLATDGKSLSQHGAVGEAGRDPSGQLWVYVQRDSIPNADSSQFDFKNSSMLTRAIDSIFGVPADRGTETGHEFGHALYGMNIGRSGQYNRNQDNGAALDLENKVRQGRDPSAPVRKVHE